MGGSTGRQVGLHVFQLCTVPLTKDGTEYGPQGKTTSLYKKAVLRGRWRIGSQQVSQTEPGSDVPHVLTSSPNTEVLAGASRC